jgi:hypothetical protein
MDALHRTLRLSIGTLRKYCIRRHLCGYISYEQLSAFGKPLEIPKVKDVFCGSKMICRDGVTQKLVARAGVDLMA